MIKIVGNIAVTPHYSDFTFDTAPPVRVGDEAIIVTAWRERIQVMLLADDDGRPWLVAINRKKAPIIKPMADRRYRRKGRTEQVRQNRQARLVAKALKLKRQLNEVMDQIRGRRP